jgi:hypothetical protein
MKRRAVIVNRLEYMTKVEYIPISMEEYEYYLENCIEIPKELVIRSTAIDKEKEEELIEKSNLYNYGTN